MLNKLFVLVVISLLQFTQLCSQTPSYYHYTSSDGLASSTVYNIIQDRNGFIWFATLNGMSRFDGKHFTTFRTKEGLNSNSIISLAEGNKGELYIGNYEKGVNVLRNGRIENYCSEIDGKSFALSYLLLVKAGKDEQKLYAYRSRGEINSISKKKIGGLVTNIFNTSPIYINKLELLPNGKIMALTQSGLFNLKNDTLIRLQINGLPDTAVYCLTQGDDGSYFIGTKGMIYRIKNNNVIRRYKINLYADNNDVTTILRDKNNNLWFSIMNRGFFFIPNGLDKIIDIGSKMDLQNTLVNNYLEDNEGNIWVSTFGKGVYCINNLYLKNYNENDGMSSNSVYSIVKESSGKLLIGTFNGINILENGKFDYIKSNSAKTLTEYIYSIKNINNDFYVCGSFGRDEMENISHKGMKIHMLDRLSICKTGNGLYLFGTGKNSIRIQRDLDYEKDQSYLFTIFGDSSNVNRVNEIFEDTQKNVWIGTGLGLCKVVNPSDDVAIWKKSFFPSNPILNSRINSIIQDSKNNVWFAGDKGIASYNLTNNSVSGYTNIKGYDLSSSTSLTSDNKNRIWIGNMKGLYLFDGNSIKHLNKQTGLPSNEVYSLFYDREKNFLYIGTSNGISFLDINLFDNYVPLSLNVKIISIQAGDTVYTSYNHLVFEPKQHDVSINFKALNFSSPGSVKYKYKFNGGEWVETEHDFLNFISLKNGKYELQIMAKSQNSGWGKPYNLRFEVEPRYNETIWFKLGRILVIVLVSISFVTWRLKLKNKKIKEELELTERINELKHQALSAMMNPHFIYNALNSVQYLINCNRNEEANDYIAMMAKLIRKNLDTAGSGFILLSEEINRLQLYLDLEKLRFQESFSYEINAAADVDTNSIMIPNMIIQPFVENTLWHGIINSGSKGLVTISFSFEDVDIDSIICRSLMIKVTDNGIGIKEAKKHKKEDHISKGIQIIEERLRLLSTKMQLPQPIMFEDLSSRNNNSHGTEVIVSLPAPLYKIIITESRTLSLLTD
ncbi:MAG: two-component regulator propeller domain-containing protein [Flavobacteriaceae bacterium]|nr:two-component regulator propeller domain-containing protein [Flavobacteriaceae bacterium]